MLSSRGALPHTLHALCQPNLTACRLPSAPRILPLAFKLLRERNAQLSTLELTCCKVRIYAIKFIDILLK